MDFTRLYPFAKSSRKDRYCGSVLATTKVLVQDFVHNPNRKSCPGTFVATKTFATVPVQVPGMKNQNTGVNILHGELSVRICDPIQNSAPRIPLVFDFYLPDTCISAKTLRMGV